MDGRKLGLIFGHRFARVIIIIATFNGDLN